MKIDCQRTLENSLTNLVLCKNDKNKKMCIFWFLPNFFSLFIAEEKIVKEDLYFKSKISKKCLITIRQLVFKRMEVEKQNTAFYSLIKFHSKVLAHTAWQQLDWTFNSRETAGTSIYIQKAVFSLLFLLEVWWGAVKCPIRNLRFFKGTCSFHTHS